MVNKKCVYCQIVFKTKKHNQKFCSPACGFSSRRKKVTWAIELESRYAYLTPCWNCTSHKKLRLDQKYPGIKAYGSIMNLHRYLYEELFGFLDKNIVVRHKCDNTFCINPEHWVSGTQKDNMQDCYDRGRSNLIRQRWRGRRLSNDSLISTLRRQDKRLHRLYNSGFSK